MKNHIKKILYLFLFIFFIIGSIVSLDVGISHDEYHEEANWNFNFALIKDIYDQIFLNKESNFDTTSYKDRYYGIGFQIISQPIQFLLKEIVINYQNINEYGAKLMN